MTFEKELKGAIDNYANEPMADFSRMVMGVVNEWTWKKPVVDGELVKPGHVLYGKSDGKEWVVKEIGFYGDESCGGKYPSRYQMLGTNDYVTKPLKASWMTRTPPAIAADGKPLEVGQTVYEIETGIALKITNIFKDYLEYEICEAGGFVYKKSFDTLTHTKPVFDADGMVIKEGDTLYDIEGAKLTNCKVLQNRESSKLGDYDIEGTDEHGEKVYACSYVLTHTPKDTLERIREDAIKSWEEYWDCNGIRCSECKRFRGTRPKNYYGTVNCWYAMRLNLISRTINVLERDAR